MSFLLKHHMIFSKCWFIDEICKAFIAIYFSLQAFNFYLADCYKFVKLYLSLTWLYKILSNWTSSAKLLLNFSCLKNDLFIFSLYFSIEYHMQLSIQALCDAKESSPLTMHKFISTHRPNKYYSFLLSRANNS